MCYELTTHPIHCKPADTLPPTFTSLNVPKETLFMTNLGSKDSARKARTL